MQLHYFPIVSYVLARCVHYCPEDFASTITQDPLKFACDARLNISTALNIISDNLIVITHASLLQTLNCASIVEIKFWLYSKHQVQKPDLSPKMSTGIIWMPLSRQEQTPHFIKMKGCFANIWFSLLPHPLQRKPCSLTSWDRQNILKWLEKETLMYIRQKKWEDETA